MHVCCTAARCHSRALSLPNSLVLPRPSPALVAPFAQNSTANKAAAPPGQHPPPLVTRFAHLNPTSSSNTIRRPSHWQSEAHCRLFALPLTLPPAFALVLRVSQAAAPRPATPPFARAWSSFCFCLLVDCLALQLSPSGVCSIGRLSSIVCCLYAHTLGHLAHTVFIPAPAIVAFRPFERNPSSPAFRHTQQPTSTHSERRLLAEVLHGALTGIACYVTFIHVPDFTHCSDINNSRINRLAPCPTPRALLPKEPWRRSRSSVLPRPPSSPYSNTSHSPRTWSRIIIPSRRGNPSL